ncbi:MAG TPA: SpoIIE family protein phosphatase [Vicinamibacterales bacterium]|jgi:sigma-B regulation protein RsbU (phosphoserine phosphatase)|nr:SpoIIE family protein phosphatase [Vicinamibacterales bacterium]
MTFGFRSFTTRLIVTVLGACGAVFLITLALSHSRSRATAIRTAEREAVGEAKGAISGIQAVLRAIERSTQLVGAAFSAGDSTPEAIDPLLRGFLSTHADVFGSAVAFATNRPGGPRSPYLHRRSSGSSSVELLDLASPDYRYWEREWYTVPAKTGEPRWSEPYFDEGGGDVLMVTYSVPVTHEGSGSRVLDAIVTADLDLAWLNRLASTIHAGRTGFGMIVSREGRILGHPAPEWVGRARLPKELPSEAQAREGRVVLRLLRGGAGFEPIDLDGRTYRMSFAPVGLAGWSVAVLYPEDELFADVRALRAVQAGLVAAGLTVLAIVIVLLSRRLTRPLKDLSQSAEQIATGDLDLELPPVRSQDETGRLTASFHNMRDSLKKHIQELQETTAAKERLESELKVARRIQMDMLPRKAAGGEGFELTATLVPARAVGGDLYDHFMQDGSRVVFMVGDVSGKGVPAALFMARTKTLLEAIAVREPDPAMVLRELNQALSAENEAGMFVTAVLCTLDTRNGELAFAVAGHEAPVLVPNEGEPSKVEAEGGPVMGLLEGSEYPLNRVTLNPGDALVLFTDGVNEAQNVEGEFFGPERLTAAAAEGRAEGTPGLTGAVLTAVRAFAGDAPQSDDITILTLKYLAQRKRVA